MYRLHWLCLLFWTVCQYVSCVLIAAGGLDLIGAGRTTDEPTASCGSSSSWHRKWPRQDTQLGRSESSSSWPNTIESKRYMNDSWSEEHWLIIHVQPGFRLSQSTQFGADAVPISISAIQSKLTLRTRMGQRNKQKKNNKQIDTSFRTSNNKSTLAVCTTDETGLINNININNTDKQTPCQ